MNFCSRCSKCNNDNLHLVDLPLEVFVAQSLVVPEQMSRDGTVVRALGIICGLSLLLVLILVPRGFSPGTPVFPSPKKTTLLNSNSIWKVSPISAMR